MIRTLSLVLALLTTDQRAHPLEGVWTITFPWHVEVVNGVVTPTMETAEMKVEIQGDSLVATIARTPTTDTPNPRPIRLAAPLGTGETVFETRDRVTMSMGSGGERTMIAVSTWVLKPDGDRLGGSLERRLEGAPSSSNGPLPLSGARVRR
jgi:hypothetical protein